MCCYFNFSGLRETPPRPDDMTEMTYQLRNPYHFHLAQRRLYCRRRGALPRLGPLAARQSSGHRPGPRRPAGLPPQFPRRHLRSPSSSNIRLTTGRSCSRKRGRCPAAGSNRPCTLTARRVAPTSSTDGSTANRPGTRAARTQPLPSRARPAGGGHPWRQAVQRRRPGRHGYAGGHHGRMAAYSGQEITWQQVLDSKVRLAPQAYAFDAPPPAVPDKTGRYPVAMPGVTRPY